MAIYIVFHFMFRKKYITFIPLNRQIPLALIDSLFHHVQGKDQTINSMHPHIYEWEENEIHIKCSYSIPM